MQKKFQYFFSAHHMYPTQVKVHSYSSDSVKVTFRGVATTAEEEPLQGYKVRYSIRSKIYAQKLNLSCADSEVIKCNCIVCKGAIQWETWYTIVYSYWLGSRTTVVEGNRSVQETTKLLLSEKLVYNCFVIHLHFFQNFLIYSFHSHIH